MSPTPYNLKLGGPSTPILTRRALMIHSQSKLYPRSAGSSGSGSLERNTIIFIVIGIVCLLVILTGFYLVSRPRKSSTPQSVHGSQPPSSPTPPHSQPDMSERWKIWKIWRHTGSIEHPITPDTPTSNVSPPAAPIASTIIPITRRGSKSLPQVDSRPSHGRRVTSLSVATSFSNSHITDEALNNFRVSAYDLDGDLEVEMLNSARDDVWPGHVLAMEDCCEEVSVEEPRCIGEFSKGSDYENAGAHQRSISEDNGKVEKDDARGIGEDGKSVITMMTLECVEVE